jgi:outer membrane protein assembly factor BamB
MGPARRVLAADYERGRAAIVEPDGRIAWEYPIEDIHDLWYLPGGNILLQTSWTKIVEVSPGGDVVWEYDAARANGNRGRRVEVHAFQPLEDASTMLVESGTRRIIEVDREGRLQKEIRLKVDGNDVHHDTRQARKLKDGHYLVAHEGDESVREYDEEGNVVWEYDVTSQVFSAERLENGNTLIGTGDGHRVIEVNPEGKVVWSIEENDLPGIRLAWVTMVERLENGNTRLVNCHAGPDNPQIIEVTPENKVVWTFRDFTTFGNAMPVARVLEE